ncbi:MAG: TIM barrel protein [Alphaproteobacteria bacterium]|nr:TIM barrel protein [Alphaproteobacteria bacterium]
MSHSRKLPPIGLAHLTALAVPPREFVELAARTGFQSVGLRLFAADPGAPVYSLPVGSPELRELRDTMTATGVGVFDIETITLRPTFTLEGVAAVFEGARELGARRLTVSGDDPDYVRLVSNFAALCDLAHQYDLSVDFENLGWRSVATFGQALELVRSAQQPNAGVLVDALHFFRNGGKLEALTEAPPAVIRSIQLCDAPERAPSNKEEMIAEARGARLPPGEGVFDLLGLIAAVPPDSALSVEVPMSGDLPVDERVKRIYDATRKLLLKACGG